MYILHRLTSIRRIAFELHTVAVVVVARRLSEELLHIVATGEERALIVVVDHIRIPLSAILAGKERRIAGHADHIGIALYMEQIKTFGKGIDQFLVLSCILAQIDLRLSATRIVIILAFVQEEVVLLVIVLIEDRHTKLVGEFPASLIVGVACMRTRSGSTHDDNLRISLRYAFIYIFKALDELRRDLLLVADAEILQIEGFGMTLVCTHLRPFIGSRVAISPLNEIDSLTNPLVHRFHRTSILSLSRPHLPATVGTLTAHTSRQNGYGLHSEVLTKLEVLEIAEAHALVIAPGILHLLALLLRADGSLPAIGVPEAVATTVHHASAREAQELGMQVGERLGQVLAQAMTLIGILGHQRHHVDIEVAHIEHEHHQGSFLTSGVRRQYGLIFLPPVISHVDDSLS